MKGSFKLAVYNFDYNLQYLQYKPFESKFTIYKLQKLIQITQINTN